MILELNRGRGVPYEGNYSGWLEQKKTRLAQEEKQASARQRTLDRELEWVRMSPRARQSKSKARIQKYGAGNRNGAGGAQRWRAESALATVTIETLANACPAPRAGPPASGRRQSPTRRPRGRAPDQT